MARCQFADNLDWISADMEARTLIFRPTFGINIWTLFGPFCRTGYPRMAPFSSFKFRTNCQAWNHHVLTCSLTQFSLTNMWAPGRVCAGDEGTFWPPSTHDLRVWMNCEVCKDLASSVTVYIGVNGNSDRPIVLVNFGVDRLSFLLNGVSRVV